MAVPLISYSRGTPPIYSYIASQHDPTPSPSRLLPFLQVPGFAPTVGAFTPTRPCHSLLATIRDPYPHSHGGCFATSNGNRVGLVLLSISQVWRMPAGPLKIVSMAIALPGLAQHLHD